MRKILLVILAVAALSSCVSTKKYDSMRAQAIRTERELQAVKDELAAARKAAGDLKERNLALEAEKLRLEEQNKTLQSDYSKMLNDASAEAARMLRQLEQNQRQLERSQAELRARSGRVAELEEALLSRERALEQIRNKVSDALLGFEGKGLTITRREGKVYVSMDDKLLFRSGSFDIDPQGERAVRDLAAVLAANPDIEVMVEGHTDDVPYRSSGNLRDNLDLSVKRATTVTRLLLENKGIDPQRIISAGRGEWLPVDAADTPEARARNRRTEIILTPKLDELLRLAE